MWRHWHLIPPSLFTHSPSGAAAHITLHGAKGKRKGGKKKNIPAPSPVLAPSFWFSSVLSSGPSWSSPCLSSAAGPARRGQIQSDHAMFRFPWLAQRSQPWLPSRPSFAAQYEGEAYYWLTWSIITSLSSTSQQPHNHGDSNPWPFSRSRLAVDVREHGLPLVVHHHVVALSLTEFEARRASHSNLRTFCCPLFADGGRRRGHFLRSSFISSFSPRVLRRPTDSLAPRNTFLRCGLLCSSVLSFVLLSQYLPSRVTAPIRDGRYCGGQRCSKVPVSRSLTVPLLGSVPSRCRCFTLSCAA